MTTSARPTRPEDIDDLAPRLRKEDRDEVFAINGCSPRQALLDGFKLSDECWTIVHNEVVIGMFGVAPLEEGVGAIWLLASDDLPKARWEFLKKTRPWITYFLTKYKTLTNMVDSRNSVHVKWIKWAGFQIIGEALNIGPEKVTFLHFSKQRDHACVTLPQSRLSL
jgi:hypothetical protein